MTTTRKAGRPRAASRQLLEEAACELFLEQGFATTSVAQITSRAGVSRSTFFNYFETKSDLLWATFDELVAELPSALRQAHEGGADQRAAVTSALHQVAHRLPADNVALAFSQDAAMGLGEELSIAAVRRGGHVRDAVASFLRLGGQPTLRAEVLAASYAGALMAAVRDWSLEGPARVRLPDVLDEALRPLAALGSI